jgi:hypothetical protein
MPSETPPVLDASPRTGGVARFAWRLVVAGIALYCAWVIGSIWLGPILEAHRVEAKIKGSLVSSDLERLRTWALEQASRKEPESDGWADIPREAVPDYLRTLFPAQSLQAYVNKGRKDSGERVECRWSGNHGYTYLIVGSTNLVLRSENDGKPRMLAAGIYFQYRPRNH